LISDRGTPFLSRLFEAFTRLCHSLHRTSTAYHLQTNGLTERLNHTLTDIISLYVSPDHSNWDRVLPFATYAYNTSRQPTHGYTPFQLHSIWSFTHTVVRPHLSRHSC